MGSTFTYKKKLCQQRKIYELKNDRKETSKTRIMSRYKKYFCPCMQNREALFHACALFHPGNRMTPVVAHHLLQQWGGQVLFSCFYFYSLWTHQQIATSTVNRGLPATCKGVAITRVTATIRRHPNEAKRGMQTKRGIKISQIRTQKKSRHYKLFWGEKHTLASILHGFGRFLCRSGRKLYCNYTPTVTV